MPETKRYTVLVAGFLDRWREAGDTVRLTDRQAKYPALNGQIEVAAEPKPAGKPASGRRAAPGPKTPTN